MIYLMILCAAILLMALMQCVAFYLNFKMFGIPHISATEGKFDVFGFCIGRHDWVLHTNEKDGRGYWKCSKCGYGKPSPAILKGSL